MVAERDAEQVENLAFVPIGRVPDAVNRVDRRIGPAHFAFDADARITFYRVQMRNDFKARLRRMPVDRGESTKPDIVLFVLEIAGKSDDLRGIGNMGDFAKCL